MTLINGIMLVAALLYTGFIAFMLVGLRRLKPCTVEASPVFVSVIVPARNEAENIIPCLRALLNQTWPGDKYEIIVVVDASEDGTLPLIREMAAQHSRINVMALPADPLCSAPKKRALDAGIHSSRGEFLLFTDADCLVHPQWIETVMRCFAPQTGLVASWLLIQPGASLLSRLEVIDSLSLVLVGASGFGWGKPFIANGANLAYRKSVFKEVNGFSGIENTTSGDDDLFLHKVVSSGVWQTEFAVSNKAIVTTQANYNWSSFFRQRLRWASKTTHYPVSQQLLELGIYIFFVLLLSSVPLAFLMHSFYPILLLLIKSALDYLFMSTGAHKVNRKIKLWECFLADVLQIGYIVFIGAMGPGGRFTWKGRSYNRGKRL